MHILERELHSSQPGMCQESTNLQARGVQPPSRYKIVRHGSLLLRQSAHTRIITPGTDLQGSRTWQVVNRPQPCMEEESG